MGRDHECSELIPLQCSTLPDQSLILCDDPLAEPCGQFINLRCAQRRPASKPPLRVQEAAIHLRAGSLKGLAELPLEQLIKIMGSVTSGRKLREWLDAITPIAR